MFAGLVLFQSFPIVLPFLYFVVPWIHFYDSSLTTCGDCSPAPVSPGANSSNQARISQVPEHARKPRKDKMQPKYKFRPCERFQFYFKAPVTKFHYSMVRNVVYTVFCITY